LFGSIRQRLVLLVLLVALPMMAATSLVIYHFAQTQIAAQRAAMVSGTRTLAAAVDGEIEKHIAIGKALATARSLENDDLATFYGRAVEAMKFVPDSWLLLVDRDGQQLINTSRPFGTPLPKISDLGPHIEAMESGRPAVANIFRGTVTPRPLASVHVPVLRDGKAIYNLIITMDPKSFLAILRAQQVPEGWLSGIIDRNGNFVARSRDHDKLVGTPASAGWRNASRQAKEGQFDNLSIEGVSLHSSFINSALSGWSVSLAATQNVVVAPLRRSLVLIVLTASTLIALGIALAWWAARRIATPMLALERAAGALLRAEHPQIGRTGVREIDQALAALEASTTALLERERQFHTLADSIPQLAWMADSTGWIFWYNQRWFEYTGATLEETQGWGWRTAPHPDHVDRVVVRIKHSFDTGEPWEDTFPIRGADGEYRWFLSRALPIRDAEGKIVRWFGTNTDVSEQKQTEDRQRLLVNELNHRVKNTLAVIQSIASVTSRSAASAAAFSKSFIARIIGIARTHDLLTESHWEGASLNAMLWNEMSPHQSDGAQRILLRGDYVRLAPKTAVALGMVLHEMTTNAAKYGALSVPDGRVEVTWAVAETEAIPLLRIEWTESGGPPVSVPTHKGFGSRLIAQSFTRDLAGRAEMEYLPEGLRCVLEVPLAAVPQAAHAA
jgi:PAS domain S-box-containing protein